jgi:hypothetical protein
MFLEEMAAFGDDQAAGDDRAAALGSNFERTRKEATTRQETENLL